MLRVGLRGDHPRDLRQGLGKHILLELVEERSALEDVGAGFCSLRKWAARLGVLILVEVEQGVVAVVADVGVLGVAPALLRCQPQTGVLINPPRDTRSLQALRVGAPAIAFFGVVDHWTAACAIVPDPAGPHIVAIRVGRAQNGAVVRIADRKGIGQREVVGNIGAGQVRHGRSAFCRNPAIVFALVPRGMRGDPVMRQVFKKLQAKVGCGGVKGQRKPIACTIGLIPHRLARGQQDGAGIAKAAHAAQCAEVVIERAVFLHQDDDVFYVLNGSGAVVGRDAQGTRDALRKRRGERATAKELQKCTPIGRHGILGRR